MAKQAAPNPQRGLPPGLSLQVANEIAAGKFNESDFYFLKVGDGGKGTTEYMLAVKDTDGSGYGLLEPLGRILLGGEAERLAIKHERGN